MAHLHTRLLNSNFFPLNRLNPAMMWQTKKKIRLQTKIRWSVSTFHHGGHNHSSNADSKQSFLHARLVVFLTTETLAHNWNISWREQANRTGTYNEKSKQTTSYSFSVPKTPLSIINHQNFLIVRPLSTAPPPKPLPPLTKTKSQQYPRKTNNSWKF